MEKAERKKLWRNLLGMYYSTKFLWNFETARSKRYLDLGKKQLHLLTGFHTGHFHLRKHLGFCGEEEEPPFLRRCLGRDPCKSEELASLKPSQILDFIRYLEMEGEL